MWLIDFARTREGHTLFDFAHLGAEIVAHVLAVRADSAADFGAPGRCERLTGEAAPPPRVG